MRTIQSFDPSVGASGQITTQTVNPCSVIVLFNHSLNGLALAFPDGSTANLPPWYFRYYYLSIPGNVQWAKSFALTSTGPPVSLVTGEVYEPSEAANRTFTEGPLPLQTNVGNTVNTNAGGSNSVQNDANASGTTYIESTVTGSPGSNVIVQNQGLIQVLQWVGGVLTQIFKTDPGAASVVKLGNTGLTVEALGSMTVDQVLTAIGNTSLSTLLTSGLATLNSLAVTNNATVGGTLGVTGNTSMSTASTSGKATLNSVEVTTTLKVDTTTEHVGNVAFDANPILSNAVPLQSKDSGGTARTILQVDGANNTQLFGIQGLDLIQLLDHTGVLKIQADLVNAILKIVGTSQTVNGSTSGSMTVNEILDGSVKVVVVEENAMFQGAGKNMVTLKKPFTTFMWIFNGGCGGVRFDSGGVAQSYNEVNWGTNGGVGNTNAVAYAPHTTAGYISHAVDAIGANGGDAGANNGVTIVIGK